MSDSPAANTPARISETPSPSEADYEAICAAVMETSRGRWFLAEYARRNRQADTETVLSAIERLESVVRGESTNPSIDRMRFDLIEMAKAIARTKSEIAAIKPDIEHHGRIGEATEELDSIVRTTERATSEILAAAEQIQEIAWTMREHGVDVHFCDQLDARATEIYTACSFQDLTGQRIDKVIEAMQFLENRINAMVEIWGADVQAPTADAPDDSGENRDLDQADIDTVMGPGPTVMMTAEVLPASAEEVPARPPEPRATVDLLADVVFDSPFFGPNQSSRPTETHAAPQEFALPDTPDDAQPVFDVAPEPAVSTEPPPVVDGPPAKTAAPAPVKPMPAGSRTTDPLAAIQALSDEEKIALFS